MSDGSLQTAARYQCREEADCNRNKRLDERGVAIVWKIKLHSEGKGFQILPLPKLDAQDIWNAAR